MRPGCKQLNQANTGEWTAYYYQSNQVNNGNLVGVDVFPSANAELEVNYTDSANGNLYTTQSGCDLDLDGDFTVFYHRQQSYPGGLYTALVDARHGNGVGVSFNGGLSFGLYVNTYNQTFPFGGNFHTTIRWINKGTNLDDDHVQFSMLPAAPKSDQQAGLSGDDELGALTLYPNPASSNFTVLLPKAVESELNLQLVDLQGRTVLNKVFTEGQQHLRVDLPANLAHGLYLVQLNGSDYNETLRVVIGQ